MPPICHVITSLTAGGAQLALVRLLAARDDLRAVSSVVSLTAPAPIVRRLRALGVPVMALDMPRGRPSLRGFVRLVRYFRQTRPRIVHTWLYHADLLGLLAARFARVPVVLWNVRSSDMDMRQYAWLSGLTRRLCALLSALPDAVVVNSHRGQSVHAQLGYRPRRWVVIPNGVDTDEFRPRPEARASMRRELGLEASDFVIGLIARFDPMKDHRSFFAAAALLQSRHPEARFLLVGEGIDLQNGALLRLIDERGITRNSVRLLGERDDMTQVMCAIDVGVCSSAFGEGFPNAVAEAMACEVPTVVTDVGDARELVGDSGIVVSPSSPDALAAAWDRVIAEGPAARGRRGAAGRERVCRAYSLSAASRRYRTLYDEFLAPGGVAA